MIAEKLLACCRATFGSANTIALYVSSTAPDGAPPLPVVHDGLFSASGVVVASGALQFSAGDMLITRTQPSTAVGTQDFAVDMFFDDALPLFFAGYGESYGIVYCDSASSVIYVSTSGAGFEHSIPMTIGAGTHHVCVGRQSGVVSAWLDGVRIYRAPDTTPSVSLATGVSIGALALPYTGVVRDFRVTVGIDLYGDSATITVPTLPLGIV